MDTLKQLQEKGDAEFDIKFPFAIIDWKLGEENDGDGTVINKITEIKSFLHQQTTLAYNAGKADMLDTVLKEIDTMIVHRPDELIKLNKDLPSILQEQSYLQAIGYCEALDTLKNKLLDNK